jgi:PAS domain S-box-containing protein
MLSPFRLYGLGSVFVELMHDYPKALATVIHFTLDDRGYILSANAAAFQCLGYTAQTLIGHSLIQLCHPDEQAAIKADFTALLQQPNLSLSREFGLIHADGNFVRFQITAQTLQMESGQPILLMSGETGLPPTLLPSHLSLQPSDLQSDFYGQADFYGQIQRLNAELERQVQERTEELQLAFEFEATLKRITDRVRDSLDEDQILQTAVRELAMALGVTGCNAAVYDLDHRTSTVRYEYTISLALQGRVLQMDNFAAGYNQLLQGQFFQFCSLTPNPDRGQGVMIACPILDDQGVLGDLWLTSRETEEFSDQDIRLVQQVANQCAIALRQARLYQKAQAQVEELEKLNRLKDDFLSTVSHELRTPMANIKLSTQMLEISLRKADLLGTATSAPLEKYVKILHAECQREISLINDLLDLSRLEAGSEPLVLNEVVLSNWISRFIEPFLERAHNQQQHLQVLVPSTLPPVMTDTFYLERLLGELLNNACKYTPPQETITLTIEQLVEPVGAEPAIATAFLTAVGENTQPPPAEPVAKFVLTVCNSGVEISSNELTRIFDKFYRIPNNDPWKHGGTGLGLALVKRMVDTLGGTIQVSSAAGVTCFRVEMPVRPAMPIAEAEANAE